MLQERQLQNAESSCPFSSQSVVSFIQPNCKTPKRLWQGCCSGEFELGAGIRFIAFWKRNIVALKTWVQVRLHGYECVTSSRALFSEHPFYHLQDGGRGAGLMVSVWKDGCNDYITLPCKAGGT